MSDNGSTDGTNSLASSSTHHHLLFAVILVTSLTVLIVPAVASRFTMATVAAAVAVLALGAMPTTTEHATVTMSTTGLRDEAAGRCHEVRRRRSLASAV